MLGLATSGVGCIGHAERARRIYGTSPKCYDTLKVLSRPPDPRHRLHIYGPKLLVLALQSMEHHIIYRLAAKFVLRLLQSRPPHLV